MSETQRHHMAEVVLGSRRTQLNEPTNVLPDKSSRSWLSTHHESMDASRLAPAVLILFLTACASSACYNIFSRRLLFS